MGRLTIGSKLGNILIMRELANRLGKRGSSKVYASCFFPGKYGFHVHIEVGFQLEHKELILLVYQPMQWIRGKISLALWMKVP
jgi:hypothetical protein